MRTKYLGVELQSPILLSSGAMSNGFQNIEAAMNAGAGAVTTPSIRLTPMIQPERDIFVYPDHSRVLNSQGHSDIHWKEWTTEIIPECRKKGYPVIGKTGYTLEDVTELVPKITEAGASAIEIIAPTSEKMAQMIALARSLTDLPVSAKMSGRWGGLEEVAAKCIEAGASAVTLMDTPGPALRLDVTTGESVLTGNTSHGWGFGWMSGAAILPLTLAYIAKIRRAYPDIPINGAGGVMSGEDALQMILCGANVVSVQSAVLAEGPESITRINRELEDMVGRYWGSLDRACGAAQKNLESRE